MEGIAGKAIEFIVFGAIIAALVLNIILITTCELLEFRNGKLGLYRFEYGGFSLTDPGFTNIGGGLIDPNFGNNPNENWLATDGCVSIQSDITSTAFNTARVCAVLALIFGAAILLFGFFKQCLFTLPCTGIIINVSHLLVQIMLALVWVVWRSDVCQDLNCKWGEGATYLLTTQCLYLVAGIFAACLPQPRSQRPKEEKPVEKAEEADEEVPKDEPEAEPEQPKANAGEA